MAPEARRVRVDDASWHVVPEARRVRVDDASWHVVPEARRVRVDDASWHVVPEARRVRVDDALYTFPLLLCALCSRPMEFSIGVRIQNAADFWIMLSAALLPQVRAEACISLFSQLRTKRSLSNCPNHVRRTKSSIKKRIITVRSMYSEQTVRPVKNGLYSFTSDRKGSKKVKLGRLTTVGWRAGRIGWKSITKIRLACVCMRAINR